MKILTCIFIFSAFFCSAQQAGTWVSITGPDNVQFYEDHIQSLPTLTQFKTKCEFDLSTMTEEERKAQRPFTPAGYELIGKFILSNDYNVILCCATIEEKHVLKLYVTDREGTIISEKEIVFKTCSSSIEIKQESDYSLKVVVPNKTKRKATTLSLNKNGILKG